MSEWQGVLFWGFLLLFGVAMWLLSPRAHDEGGFFRGTDAAGRPASGRALMLSIFISWIFAKSVTNAANLGYSHGLTGGLAYAAYWLSIPFAGFVIHRLRTRDGATGLVSWLSGRFGRAAALAFALAILVRLYNEIWSNTSVVGAYFGEPGSAGFIGSALLFTALVLAYTLKGGLRSSILTDVIQALVFLLFLGLVLGWVLPAHGSARLFSEGRLALDAGGDLLLVALLQVLSYPFHDPVLTDRGFLTDERTMLRAFLVAGLLGFVSILAFSLTGVQARLDGLPPSGNVPAALARGLGLAGQFTMLVVMISSAASTIDSTFSSLARCVARDLPLLAGREPPRRGVAIGCAAMVTFALLGNLPMLAGTDVLKATTISGTMVIGLAPVFLFGSRVVYSPLSFHLSFWSGITLGVLLTLGLIPPSWAIGSGPYALLLGTNVWGLLICCAGFWLPLVAARRLTPVTA